MMTQDITVQRSDLSNSQRALLEKRLQQARQSASRKAPTRPAIVPRSQGGNAPLSYAQERLWFLDQLATDRAVYNVYEAVRIAGPLDPLVAERCVNELIQRHAVFRTNFTARENGPVQHVAARRGFRLPVIDLADVAADERPAAVRAALQSEAAKPFDLTADLLLRALLVRSSAEEHVLLLVMHHIVSDGWTLGVIMREFAALYDAFRVDAPSPLPALAIEYSDYAQWERDTLAGPALEKPLAYWREQLAGAAPLDLPTDFPRTAEISPRGATQTLDLPVELTQSLRAISQREGGTLFMTLLAAFKVLLHRYTSQEDIVLGSCVAGRPQLELEKLAGFFVNTLVLRTSASGRPVFREFLARTRETVLNAMAHQDLPFEKLVAELRPDRSAARNPFFQVMFVLQSATGAQPQATGLQFQPLPLDNGTAKFDITLSLTETANGGLHASLEYSTDLFERATIARMLRHFHALLSGIAADPGRCIDEFELLGEAERRQILSEWNGVHTEYPSESSIVALFEAQAKATPGAIALRGGNVRVTYAELDERANQLAHHLGRLGAKPGSLIALCLDRSPDLIVALVAILKAGCAYVSLDPAYPAERLAFMVSDTRAAVLITQSTLRSTMNAALAGGATGAASPVILDLDAARAAIACESSTPVNVATTADTLAYVSYTSGSTGQPKGVCIPHRGVVRLVRNTDFAQLGANEVFLQFAPVAFDASTLEIWGPLLNGGQLAIFPPGLPSLAELGAFIREERVTTAWLTAGLFHQMVDEQLESLAELRQLLAGGDVLSPAHVSRVIDRLPGVNLINGYGPTENTTFTCCHRITSAVKTGRSIPIGRPIANTQVYILDSNLKPVPAGIPGDLYAAGDGLATGYLNRPELTREKFVENPFTPGTSMYRTGDRARWLADGTIEFLGRADRQVKIRGFRIEPDEIEKALEQHASVRQAVIVVRGTGGDKKLVAYVTSRDASRPTPQSIRQHLARKLPDYMVPSAIVVLDEFPLNANGKVDRNALPSPETVSPTGPVERVAPRSDVETRLVDLWRKVLNVTEVGVTDNFFEMGGHSMAGVRLFAQIEREFSRRLPLAALFQAPTIAELARLLQAPAASASSSHSSIIAMQPRGSRPPIFFVHGAGGGNLWIYANLVPHLGNDQPVYALESRAVRGQQDEFDRIEDMAAHYIRDIRKIQPRGPYYLSGYCFGGNVAYEMARQLEKQGEKVALLALLDSSAPNSDYWTLPLWKPVFYWRFLANVAYWFSDFADHPLSYQKEFVIRKFRTVTKKLLRRIARGRPRTVEDVDVEEVIDPTRFPEISIKLWKAHLHAVTRYQPGPYGGRVTLLRTRGQPFLCSFDPVFGWGSLAGGGVETVRLPGAHERIFMEPYVKEVSALLRQQVVHAQSRNLPPVTNS